VATTIAICLYVDRYANLCEINNTNLLQLRLLFASSRVIKIKEKELVSILVWVCWKGMEDINRRIKP